MSGLFLDPLSNKFVSNSAKKIKKILKWFVTHISVLFTPNMQQDSQASYKLVPWYLLLKLYAPASATIARKLGSGMGIFFALRQQRGNFLILQ